MYYINVSRCEQSVIGVGVFRYRGTLKNGPKRKSDTILEIEKKGKKETKKKLRKK